MARDARISSNGTEYETWHHESKNEGGVKHGEKGWRDTYMSLLNDASPSGVLPCAGEDGGCISLTVNKYPIDLYQRGVDYLVGGNGWLIRIATHWASYPAFLGTSP
jgi:hypothetical protein